MMNLHVQFTIAFLSLICFNAIGGESLPDNCTILPISEGSALMKQCSRGSPTNVSGFWIPSPEQVNTIEKLLPEFLFKNGGDKIKLSNSCRQYMGIISNGKKIIYLNSLIKSVAAKHDGRLDWHKKAVIICDGGEAFWGVEFNPDENIFYDLQFNGIA